MSDKSALPTPSFQELLKNPILLLGFGFGSGLTPKGPGTAGTLLGWLLFIPLMLWSMEWAWAVFIVALFTGSFICGWSSDYLNVHDHGGIVWDEFVGVWLVLLLLPQQNWTLWIAAFVLFRVFDIWKPWPINWADNKVHGGFGIMLDDVLAGLMALLAIWGFVGAYALLFT